MANSARKGARLRRLAAIAVVALALAPGLVWRDPPVRSDGPPTLTVARLKLPRGASELAPGLRLVGGWHLDSRSDLFGGYSALLALPGGELLALSDRGRFLRFGAPDRAPLAPAMGAVGGADDRDKRRFDIESATRDPASGTIWLGYESRNAIRRVDPRLAETGETRPKAMRQWPSNRGPEALVRLADGRFVVLSEALSSGGRPFAEGLLFAGDPVAGAAVTRFRFVPPEGFRPTDMAQLPDGRVLVLLRRLDLALPPRLASRLVVADPAAIREDGEWLWRPLAEIAAPLPAENYEGLAVEPRGEGVLRLWLIADDNSSVIQRTLLLALDWHP